MRMLSIREASVLGGSRGVSPIARISTLIGSKGKPPPCPKRKPRSCRPGAQRAPSRQRLWPDREQKNHQRHGGCVESIIRDGKRHGVAAIEFGQTGPGPRARKGELGLGWINTLDFSRCTSFDEQFAEPAITAADVDPPQARRRRKPIYEYRAGNPAPRSHHPLVGGAVVEANLTLGHEYFRPCRSGSNDSSGSQPFSHLSA